MVLPRRIGSRLLGSKIVGDLIDAGEVVGDGIGIIT